MTNRERLKAAQVAQISSTALTPAATNANDSAVTAVAAAHSRHLTALITDGGTAGTAVTETVMARLPDRGKVTSIYGALPVAITASDTDTAVITVARRTAAGSAVTVGVASILITAGTGNVAAFVPFAFTLTDANVQCAAGDVLTVKVVKGASGKAIAAATSSANITAVVEAN